WATDVAPAHVAALIGTGSTAAAEEFLGDFVEGLGDRDAPAPAAAVTVCRGLLAEAAGDHRRAAALFGEAARAWAAMSRPYDELLAAERRGRCLLAVDPAGAAAVLTDTETRLRTLGARWDADRVARLL